MTGNFIYITLLNPRDNLKIDIVILTLEINKKRRNIRKF